MNIRRMSRHSARSSFQDRHNRRQRAKAWRTVRRFAAQQAERDRDMITPSFSLLIIAAVRKQKRGWREMTRAGYIRRQNRILALALRTGGKIVYDERSVRVVPQ